jgi:transcriptional regulator with XRE-family HTH domain
MKMNPKKIGETIKTLREALGLSRQDLAKALNIHIDTVLKWEKGIRIPSDDLKLQISAALGMSVQYIFFD